MNRGILVVVVCVLVVLLHGCRNSNGSDTVTAENPAFEDTATTGPDTIYAGTRDTTIILHDGEARIQGRLEGKKNSPTYILPAWKGQTLVAIIKPLKKGGKIRIKEIIQPGGITAGPFGDSLSFKFTSNGNMRLVIGSNMAGKPYTGDYLLKITLK